MHTTTEPLNLTTMKGTETEKNLLKAFAGESQAMNRYTFYANVAKKEGYEQIAAIFAETAEQEREHAKRFFKFLKGGMVEIAASFPAGVISHTPDNLREAAQGEYDEWAELYPEYADVAQREGFHEVEAIFRAVAKVEQVHEERFRKLLSRLEDGSIFSRDEPIEWQCRNCGYVHSGTDAPEICPACAHKRAYFEEKKSNL